MKKYKPTSAGRRGMSVISYKEIVTQSTPLKKLTKGYRRGTGRNNRGIVTTPHKGGGVKRNLRDIDFVYSKRDIPATVTTIEYDPNRSSYIMLVTYKDGAKRYHLLPKGMKVGDTFIVGNEVPVAIGNRMMLKNIPVGTQVYAVELKPNGGAKLARSAGGFLQVIANDDGYTSLRMPSTEVRKVVQTCFASIGVVSNDEWKLMNLGKAGRNRKRGVRPTVRGSAMNPVDHPHGGGEGRQGIGLRRGPKTRHGKLAYGVKTRTPKKYSNVFLVSRRKTKRNK